MNKTTIIVSIGALTLLGVGAYLYFKPKTKEATTGSSGVLGQTGSGEVPVASVPQTGTTLETPQQVAETAKKMAEAKELASKITELKKGRTALLLRPLSYFGIGTSSIFSSNNSILTSIKNTAVANTDKKIRELEIQLSKLGYTELNGNLVKIV